VGVRILGRNILEIFSRKHASATKPLSAWRAFVERAEWKTTADVKRDFAAASFLSGNRIVFNIGGNRFRLLVTAVFCKGRILVEKVGTHAEYDRWKL
jgi:mRNA interferase HigB